MSVQQLHAMNVRTGLVSNTDVRMREYPYYIHHTQPIADFDVPTSGAVLEDLGVLSLLDPVLLSEEQGVEKPSAEMYRRAGERADVTAGEIVHVGDELKAYVLPHEPACAIVKCLVQ